MDGRENRRANLGKPQADPWRKSRAAAPQLNVVDHRTSRSVPVEGISPADFCRLRSWFVSERTLAVRSRDESSSATHQVDPLYATDMCARSGFASQRRNSRGE